MRLLEDHGLWRRVPESVRTVLRRDDPTRSLPEAANYLVGSNAQSGGGCGARPARCAGRNPPPHPRCHWWAMWPKPPPRIVATADRPGVTVLGGEKQPVTLAGTGGRAGRIRDWHCESLWRCKGGTWRFCQAGTRAGPTRWRWPAWSMRNYCAIHARGRADRIAGQ